MVGFRGGFGTQANLMPGASDAIKAKLNKLRKKKGSRTEVVAARGTADAAAMSAIPTDVRCATEGLVRRRGRRAE